MNYKLQYIIIHTNYNITCSVIHVEQVSDILRKLLYVLIPRSSDKFMVRITVTVEKNQI